MLPNLSRRHLPISALHNRLKGFRDPQNKPLNSGVLAPVVATLVTVAVTVILV